MHFAYRKDRNPRIDVRMQLQPRRTGPAAFHLNISEIVTDQLGKNFQARAKMMQEGLPVSTTWPVGVSLPVAVSTVNTAMLSLSRFAA